MTSSQEILARCERAFAEELGLEPAHERPGSLDSSEEVTTFFRLPTLGERAYTSLTVTAEEVVLLLTDGKGHMGAVEWEPAHFESDWAVRHVRDFMSGEWGRWGEG